MSAQKTKEYLDECLDKLRSINAELKTIVCNITHNGINYDAINNVTSHLEVKKSRNLFMTFEDIIEDYEYISVNDIRYCLENKFWATFEKNGQTYFECGPNIDHLHEIFQNLNDEIMTSRAARELLDELLRTAQLCTDKFTAMYEE